ncbi:energy-coupling factor transporter ATPase [Aneurinibacillus sp. Ricciae_BoGa-3]|uniref:ABC transporter ATP-binding protein n=1 Tax=Aneurinibacillus sp. Ricciae_BoGa-3 TaxID=3022697 RepID=UPI002340D236|nr:ABC transporter ATP-binding protein [Aneurinibacillus sp. Ricciae_BoGa-3]WCK56605.1 energy-coupling factor transporter ATPase [Aneurinibacillus sp. Ricciae_BoGa-3]
MEILELKNVSFSYPDGTAAIKNVTVHIQPGEFIVVAGSSGSGKSTLLKLIKKEIQPVGVLEGEISYKGVPLNEQHPQRLAEEMGMIFQDPENQIVMDEVWQELAFGLENMGLHTGEIRKRVAEMANFFGMESLLARKTHELSGGQKQMVNLASVLLMQPKILLLDEPTAQLDPIAAKEFLQIIQRLNEELGMTIVLVEHRLEEVMPLADRVFLMKDGALAYQGKSADVMDAIWQVQDELFMPYVPSIAKLYLTMQDQELITPSSASEIPLSVKEGRQWLHQSLADAFVQDYDLHTERQKKSPKAQPNLLEIKDVIFEYERKGQPVLSQLNLTLRKQDFLAVVGGNGAGKTTLLKVAAGLLTPHKGGVRFRGEKIKRIPLTDRYRFIGYLAQNPKLYFVHDTVERELHYIVERYKLTEADYQPIMKKLGIEQILTKHPYDCSGGEQQKAALAGLLLTKPELLLLDEPTKGLDPVSKEELAQILQKLRLSGISIMMVTHDLEFAARYATRCALLFEGAITAEGTPQEFFQGSFFYTTVINRIFRHIMPSAITFEEVLDRWHHTVS